MSESVTTLAAPHLGLISAFHGGERGVEETTAQVTDGAKPMSKPVCPNGAPVWGKSRRIETRREKNQNGRRFEIILRDDHPGSRKKVVDLVVPLWKEVRGVFHTADSRGLDWIDATTDTRRPQTWKRVSTFPVVAG